MAEEAASRELLRFIVERVQNYEQLEALLWLSSRPSEAVPLSVLAQTLSLPEAALEEAIQRLEAAQLLSHSVDTPALIRYAPRSPELHANVVALSAFYERDRLDVVRLMTENSMRRLQTSTSETLAFLLGKRG